MTCEFFSLRNYIYFDLSVSVQCTFCTAGIFKASVAACEQLLKQLPPPPPPITAFTNNHKQLMCYQRILVLPQIQIMSESEDGIQVLRIWIRLDPY